MASPAGGALCIHYIDIRMGLVHTYVTPHAEASGHTRAPGDEWGLSFSLSERKERCRELPKPRRGSQLAPHETENPSFSAMPTCLHLGRCNGAKNRQWHTSRKGWVNPTWFEFRRLAAGRLASCGTIGGVGCRPLELWYREFWWWGIDDEFAYTYLKRCASPGIIIT